MTGEGVFRRLWNEVNYGAESLSMTHEESSLLRDYLASKHTTEWRPGNPVPATAMGTFMGVPFTVTEPEDDRTKHIFDRWGGLMRRLGEGPK